MRVISNRLLIIGGGIEQVRAYELAREMGLSLVGSDISLDAPALRLADDKIIASTRDARATLKAVVKYNENSRIDGVMTLANDVPLTVAAIATKLGLPGISIASARLAADKVLMKQAFGRAGVPVPSFREVFSTEDLKAAIKDWGYPVVIKPNDGRGSRGVLKLTAGVDLSWAYAHAKENSDKGRVIVEDFIEGTQYSTESMVYRGRCYTACISERNYEFIDRYAPNIIENGGVLPADIDKAASRSIEDVVARAARAMGINDGTVKGDIVMTPEGPLVIELAARLSGGYLCTDQIPLARGVDLVRQTIKLALGQELDTDDLVPEDICKLGVRYFFPKPGRIKSIEGFEELSELEWVSKKVLFLGVGDIVETPSNHTKRAGFVHTKGTTFQEAVRRAIEAAAMVRIETVPL